MSQRTARAALTAIRRAAVLWRHALREDNPLQLRSRPEEGTGALRHGVVIRAAFAALTVVRRSALTPQARVYRAATAIKVGRTDAAKGRTAAHARPSILSRRPV
jgi:hypothetical protein